MKIEIVAMGKVRDKHCKALVREYLGRLDHYVSSVTHTELREVRASGGQVDVALRQEADMMRARCQTDTVRVAMDERGELLTSAELSAWLEEWMLRGTRHVAFFIGSAHGLDPTLREECEHTLALSPMTFPHELARAMLAEQLYRAATIIRGEPYHK